MDYNNNQPNSWNDSSRNPYYNQPVHNPYRKEIFAAVSLLFGILSLMASCTGILALPLGAMSILFAVLASRSKRPKNGMAVAGLTLSCIGMISGILLLIYSFMLLPQTLQDPVTRQQMDGLCEQLYGMDFAEMMEEYYGVDIDE